MRTIRVLSATLLLLVACSCQDIAFIQDLFPSNGDGRDTGDGIDDGGDGDDQGDGEPLATETPTPHPQVDLRYGDSVGERLTSGRGDLWTFSGQGGDVVTITMISGEFDTFLALFDPAGNYLTCDDDSGGDYNASIIDYPLPGSGIYTINAMGLTPDSLGSYSLSISQTANGMMHPPAGGGSLSIGDTKSGSLSAWTGDAWTFNGSAGDVISVGARSDDFDTVLSIHGPGLYREAWDDDSLGDLNSLISGLTLPSTGRYTIVVRAFSDAAIGAYELGSAAGTEIPGWEATTNGGGADILYGEAVLGNLPGIQGEQWAFAGSGGDSVSISVTSEEFDTFLALFGPSGEYLTCDDDGGDGLNSLIDGFTLPESGMYVIDVLSYGGGATGSYTMTLNLTSPGVVARSMNAELITYGSTLTRTLGAWVGDEWIFVGEAGDVVTISMTSEDFDAALDLYGPDLLRIGSDDDSGGDLNSLLTVTLPTSGVYTLVARAFSSDGAGNYTLSISD